MTAALPAACEECGSPEVVIALADDASGLHGLCDPCFTVAIEAGMAMARRARSNGAAGARGSGAGGAGCVAVENDTGASGRVVVEAGDTSAAAEGDGLLSSLEGCVGNVVMSLEAVRTEFPDFMPNTVKAMLLTAWNVHANWALLLLQYESPSDAVMKNCQMADAFGLALATLRRGDPREIDQVRRGWTRLSE